MLDSGAYSVWRRGSEINLAAYIAFVKYNAPHVDHYISLDVIPGRNGQRDRSPEAVEQAAQQSYRNHCAMKDAGLHPLAVFHMDEPVKWLERMIGDGMQVAGRFSTGSRNASRSCRPGAGSMRSA
jgi:hypothetical protein